MVTSRRVVNILCILCTLVSINDAACASPKKPALKPIKNDQCIRIRTRQDGTAETECFRVMVKSYPQGAVAAVQARTVPALTPHSAQACVYTPPDDNDNIPIVPDVCSGNGICTVENKCLCTNPVYEGERCEVRKSQCPIACVRGACTVTLGVTIDTKEIFPEDCEADPSPSDASGNKCERRGGKCADTTKYTCSTGWKKGLCPGAAQTQCCINKNDLPPGVSAPGIQATCTCDPGWGGEDCGTKQCPSDCNQRGTCTNGGCQCTDWWTGTDCSSPTCPKNVEGSECEGQGVCVVPESSAGEERAYCKCNEGWEGETCAIRRCHNDCSGHGICSGGQCFCRHGYFGNDCSLGCDCSGNGVCGPGSTGCLCHEGYEGDRCELETCPGKGSSCSGHGWCQDRVCRCYPGWTGVDCSLSAPCPNNCTASQAHGVCRVDPNSDASQPTGVCQCVEPWSGDDCSVGKCLHNCYSRGDCVDNKCQCDSGYSGEYCEQLCPNHCSGNGVCIDGQCSCQPEYTGQDCSIEAKCPDDCSGHGTCDESTGKCYCYPGYTGVNCGVVQGCGIQGCGPHGLCQHGKCFCQLGYVGNHCEQQQVFCPNNCTDHGVCLAGKCHCVAGRTGSDCSSYQAPDCPKQCALNGHCAITTDGVSVCICDPGYSGVDCTTLVTCPQNCNGRGVCHRGVCYCVPEYTGHACEYFSPCQNGCSRHGLCQADGTCLCSSGWTGEACQTKRCPNDCSAHGICGEDGMCQCESDWAGDDCSRLIPPTPPTQCPNQCSGHGVCRGDVCICEQGVWTGDDCSIPVDTRPCAQLEFCNTQGSCIIDADNPLGRCQCHSQYTGTTCDELQSDTDASVSVTAGPGTPAPTSV